MELSEFLNIMEKYFDSCIVVENNERKTNANRLISFLNAFIDNPDDNNPLYAKSHDFIGKVYKGRESLPVDCCQYYLSHLSEVAFDEFTKDIEDSVLLNFIDDLAVHGVKTDSIDFIKDVTTLLRVILNNRIISVNSIRDAEFLPDNKVKIGNKIITLYKSLVPTEEIIENNTKYILALLKVYEQSSSTSVTSIDDLKNINPRYTKHLKLQRENYFSAVSVLYQIRDVFHDGKIEFDALKNETLDGIEPVLYKEYKNALERVDSTMQHVVCVSFSKCYLARNNNGLIGPAEKQGVVHMLVNDGKIEWVVDYDKDI